MFTTGLMRTLKAPARKCLRLFRKAPQRWQYADELSAPAPLGYPYTVLYDCQEEITASRNTSGPDVYDYGGRYRPVELGYWRHIPQWIHEDFNGEPSRDRQLRCLDVGCAYGTLLLYAIRLLGCKPYAIDFVKFIDSSLVKKYDIQYVVNNVERESFPWDTRFDIILFTEILEHLNFNAVPTMQKLGNLLAPGGRLYLSTPDASQWGRQTKYYTQYSDIPVFSANSKYPVIDDHVWQFDEAELRQLIADAGLRIVRLDYSPGTGRQHFNMTLATFT